MNLRILRAINLLAQDTGLQIYIQEVHLLRCRGVGQYRVKDHAFHLSSSDTDQICSSTDTSRPFPLPYSPMDRYKKHDPSRIAAFCKQIHSLIIHAWARAFRSRVSQLFARGHKIFVRFPDLDLNYLKIFDDDDIYHHQN